MELTTSERIRFTLKRRLTVTIGVKDMRKNADVGVVSLQVINEEI